VRGEKGRQGKKHGRGGANGPCGKKGLRRDANHLSYRHHSPSKLLTKKQSKGGKRIKNEFHYRNEKRNVTEKKGGLVYQSRGEDVSSIDQWEEKVALKKK